MRRGRVTTQELRRLGKEFTLTFRSGLSLDQMRASALQLESKLASALELKGRRRAAGPRGVL